MLEQIFSHKENLSAVKIFRGGYTSTTKSISHQRNWNWGIFIIFLLSIFSKTILFHFDVFQTIVISSLWKNPYYFFSFYLPKFAISLFIASFSLFFRRKYWIIYASIFIDLWIFANLIYFRSNGFFIDVFALTMVSNMAGFWDSILTYIQWSDLIYCLLTTLVIIYIFLSPKISKTYVLSGFLLCLLSIIFQISGQYCLYCSQGLRKIHYPFAVNQLNRKGRKVASPTNYLPIRDNSVLHAVAWDIIDFYHLDDDRYIMTQDDKLAISPFISNSLNEPVNIVKNNHLIVVLIESLEDWVIQPEWMPNLYRYATQYADLYCHKIKSQIRQGTSADGQMIINTGLLPIQNGAACFLYPTNIYPSLMSLTSDSNIIILPHDIAVWNQGLMNKSYHILNYETTNSNDSILFATLHNEVINSYCGIMLLTMSTHPPFVDGDPTIELPTDMPQIMQQYIRCCKVLDNGLGQWLNQITTDSIYNSYTIAITGDHAILATFRKEQIDYCNNHHTPYHAGEGYCPLIIQSPTLNTREELFNEFYQMDIYPTILSLIGCSNYWWKGFGVNLTDSISRNIRPISEDEAYELSDKIIRNNYFLYLK